MHLFREAAYVVVTLNSLGWTVYREGFNYVRVDSALSQKGHVLNCDRFLLEDVYEQASNDLTPFLGIAYTIKGRIEALPGINAFGIKTKVAIAFHYLLKLALAQ